MGGIMSNSNDLCLINAWFNFLKEQNHSECISISEAFNRRGRVTRSSALRLFVSVVATIFITALGASEIQAQDTDGDGV